MNKVIILYTQFLDFEGEHEKIGGIETYIKNLISVGEKLGKKMIIIQFANKYFEKKFDNGLIVIGVKDKKKINSKVLLKKSYEIGDISKDLLIFASSHMNTKNKYKRSLAIQHGIYWDLNVVKNHNFNKIISTFLKSLQIYLEIKRNKCVNKVVCVDYNYINWYRACTKMTSEKLVCVPNFSKVETQFIKKNNKVVKIIFARRFENIRGVKIIEKVLLRLLRDNIDFEFTFAGNGTYEEELKDIFKNYKNISFTKYKAEDSLKVHQNYDIAIVPSIGSEGTSLSLLEAMSSSCCVVSTNVGGMTNIIIDDYNGKICNTDEDSIYYCLKELIENNDIRIKLARKGYESVKEGFNYNTWSKKWGKIIDE